MLNPVPSDIVSRLRNIQRGEKVIYHVGDLSFEREQPNPRGHRVDDAGAEAWRLYEAGHVTLVQRRAAPPLCIEDINGMRIPKMDWTHGKGTFEYIAVGR